MDWALIGLILAIIGAAWLIGSAMGYYTASVDLQAEKARAWDRGWRQGLRDERGANFAEPPIPDNPYRKVLK